MAQGIYTALVTTFAGLCVAIPAIMVGNSLEARIEKLLRSMEDVFNEIIPMFERFEGKWRVIRKNDSSGVILKNTSARAEPVARPIPATQDAADERDRVMMISSVPKK